MIISQFPQRRTKNLLINAGFRVNQRVYVSGTATAAADEYTLDRWRVLVLGESITFPPLEADNTITAPAGGVGQKIESLNIKGGVYTVQWGGTANCKVNGTARKTGESFVIAADELVDVVFYGGTVNKPQIEEGSVQTGFEFVPIGSDKTQCGRFYERGSFAVFNQEPAHVSSRDVYRVFFNIEKRGLATMVCRDNLGVAGKVTIYSTVSAGPVSGINAMNTGVSKYGFTGGKNEAVTSYGVIFDWEADAEL